jgi:hypothetical protein
LKQARRDKGRPQSQGKGAAFPPKKRRESRYILKKLSFFDGDGARLTNFNAAFAAQAFFRVYGNGLAVLDLKNFHRANVYTFFTTFTFVSIYDRIKSHFSLLLC